MKNDAKMVLIEYSFSLSLTGFLYGPFDGVFLPVTEKESKRANVSVNDVSKFILQSVIINYNQYCVVPMEH